MNMNLPFKPATVGDPKTGSLAWDFYYYIWLSTGALTLLWAALTIVHPANSIVWMTFFLPMTAAFCVGLKMNSSGRTRPAIILLLITAWGVLTLVGVLYSNRIPLDNNRYLLVVVTAGLLFGKRAGYLAAAVCAVTEIIFALLIRDGFIHSLSRGLSLGMLLPHIFFLFLAASVSIFATRRVRLALRVAEEERDDMRRSEEFAQENESRYISFIDASPDAIVIHARARFLHLNPASLKLLKADSSEQLLGKSIMTFVHPDSRELVSTLLAKPGEEGISSRPTEGKLLKLDGSVAFVEISSMPVVFRGESAVQTIVKDVTQLRELREEIHLRITALNSAGNAVIITDREGNIVWANPAFEALSGYSLDEVTGKSPKELVSSGKQKLTFYKDMWDSILSGNVWHGELVNRRKDGSLYDESMTITPVRNDRGEITNFVAVKQDITARKLLEEQLLQSKKLEAIGQLAGGVAHDYNNILNVVVGYSDLLRRKLTDDDPAGKPIDSILAAAKRGAELTRQLLAFARKDIVSPKVININSSIDSIVNMLHRIIGEKIRLVFVPESGLWNVKIDPTQFDQIVVNLVTNAKDAIEGEGTITVKTFNRKFTREDIPTGLRLAPGEYVTVEFEDDGRGMDEKTLKRLFEPFFTTKPKGHGTGLGLSTVYGILKQSGGTIEVKSELGKGSGFTVYIPRFVGAVQNVELRSANESMRGTETVLVVEAQADLLTLMKTFLEECGYNVIASSSPVDAEVLVESYSGEIHLLVTNAVMPEMSGKDLSKKISRQREGLKTLFMFEYSLDRFEEGSNGVRPLDFIQKPFDLNELAVRIRQVLSHRGRIVSLN
jgi:PAS domain S-box-containing protein